MKLTVEQKKAAAAELKALCDKLMVFVNAEIRPNEPEALKGKAGITAFVLMRSALEDLKNSGVSMNNAAHGFETLLLTVYTEEFINGIMQQIGVNFPNSEHDPLQPGDNIGFMAKKPTLN